MGVVRVDLHKGERQFKDLNLSDTNVVKWLILYRDKLDLYYGEKTDNFFDHAGNSKELNQELINTYAYIDKLIELCEFKEEQLALLELLFIGYTFNDIENATKETSSRTAKRRFESICKSISSMNDNLWRMYVHRNFLKTDFKKCSKCNKEYPVTEQFFYKSKNAKDGFRNNCKKC